MGVSLNGDTPISHPKMIIFSRKSNGCWGKPTILGVAPISPASPILQAGYGKREAERVTKLLTKQDIKGDKDLDGFSEFTSGFLQMIEKPHAFKSRPGFSNIFLEAFGNKKPS